MCLESAAKLNTDLCGTPLHVNTRVALILMHRVSVAYPVGYRPNNRSHVHSFEMHPPIPKQSNSQNHLAGQAFKEVTRDSTKKSHVTRKTG